MKELLVDVNLRTLLLWTRDKVREMGWKTGREGRVVMIRIPPPPPPPGFFFGCGGGGAAGGLLRGARGGGGGGEGGGGGGGGVCRSPPPPPHVVFFCGLGEWASRVFLKRWVYVFLLEARCRG